MMPKRKFWLTGYFEDVSEHEMPASSIRICSAPIALTRFLPIRRRYLSGELFDNVWSREMTKRVTGTQG
jgi:hypothetical protein